MKSRNGFFDIKLDELQARMKPYNTKHISVRLSNLNNVYSPFTLTSQRRTRLHKSLISPLFNFK